MRQIPAKQREPGAISTLQWYYFNQEACPEDTVVKLEAKALSINPEASVSFIPHSSLRKTDQTSEPFASAGVKGETFGEKKMEEAGTETPGF